MLADIERCTHLIARHLEPVLTDLDLTQGEAHVLAELGAHAAHAGLTATQLHHDFGHKRSTLTSLLDRLERRGLVRRTPNTADRRSIIVSLTARGRPVADRVVAARTELEYAVRVRVSDRDVSGLRSITRALQEEAGR